MVDIQKIKNEHPIADVAVRLGLVKVVKQSSQAVKCLFHEPDRTPSMVIQPNTNSFECKSCGAKGDTLDLIQKVKDTDFKGALVWLGVTIFNSKEQKQAEIVPSEYIEKHRGIDKGTANKFGLKMGKYQTTTGNKLDALIIPLPNGRIHYRIINAGKFRFAFDNKQGAGNCLFKTCEPEQFLIISEGELDAIVIYQNTGFSVWTATTGGASFKTEWVDEIRKKNVQSIYLAQDADDEGDRFADELAEKIGIDVCFRLRPSDAKDWTDYFRLGRTGEDFKKLISKAKSYKAKSLLEQISNEPNGKTIKTGIRLFDNQVRLKTGETYVLGGKDKCGKSSLLMKILLNIMDSGIKCGFLDTELSPRKFTDRFAAIKKNLPIRVVEADFKYAQEFAGIKMLIRKDGDSFLEANGINYEKFRKVLTDFKELGCEVIVIDNLTSANSAEDGHGWARIGKAFRLVNEFAKENNVLIFPVIHTKSSVVEETIEHKKIKDLLGGDIDPREILSSSKTYNRKPKPSDLYGDKAAYSQLTGGILFLWRPLQDFDLHKYNSVALLSLQSARNNPSVDVPLKFIGSKLRFEEDFIPATAEDAEAIFNKSYKD